VARIHAARLAPKLRVALTMCRAKRMAARKPPVRRAKKRIGLFLHDDRPCRDMTALDYIVDVQPYQIATAQLVVDGEFEQRQIPFSFSGGF